VLACLGAAVALAQSPARPPARRDPMPGDAHAAPPAPRGAAPDEPPMLPGQPERAECAWIAGFDGLPADSLLAHAFRVGVRVGFGASFLRAERPAPDGRGWIPTLPVDNRFRLIYGTAPFDCWDLHATLAPAPPAPGDSVPGLAVGWIVHSHAMREANARPLPARDTLWLAPAPRVTAEQGATRLGRAAAVLALERMLHLSGALPERDRLSIPDVRRSSGSRR
jgi:hypothetical protein